jgi:tripartite-type tricarboxylate transporter receptor subunit TctC
LTTASALYRNLPYRSVEDFKPNRLVTAVAMTLVAKGDFLTRM